MTRTTRTLRTLYAGYAASLLNMALSFLVAPFLIGRLGNEEFGAYRVVLDYLGFLGIFEGSLTAALQFRLAKALSLDDRERVQRLLGSASRSLFFLGMLTTAITLVFAVFVEDILGVGAEEARSLRIGLVFMALGGILRPLGIFAPLLEARQRGYVVHFAMFVQNAVISLASVILVWWGAGVAGVFAAQLFGLLFFCWISMRDARSLLSPFSALIGPGDLAARIELNSIFRWNLLGSLLNRLCLASDTIVLSLFLNSAIVTPFFVTLRLASIASAYAAAIGSSAWAPMVEMYHQGLIDRMNGRLIQLTRLTAFIGCAFLVPIAVWNGAFVRAWIGPKQDAGLLVTLVGCANAWFLGISSLWGWIFNGTGQLRVVMWSVLVGTILNVAVSVIATIYLGPVGPLVGTAAQQYCVNVWWLPNLLHRRFGTSRRDLFFAMFGPFLLGVVLIGAILPLATSGWIEELHASRFMTLALTFACMGVVALIYVAFGWRLVLPQSDRDEIRARLFPTRKSPT